jgi:hypothetical protein
MLDHISSFMAGISEAVMIERTLEIVHTEGEPAPLTAAGDAGDEDDER